MKITSILTLASLLLLTSCGYSCESIGKKTSADQPSRDELEWFAKNCMGR